MIEISVVIGSFKQKDKLKEVLASFEQQTFSKDKFEVIVVDSSSCDGTKEMVLSQSESAIDWSGSSTGFNLRNYKINFKEVLNKGKSYARNQGIKEAIGKVIILTDADMIADKNFIETHWHAQQKYDFKAGFEGLTYNLKENKRPFHSALKEPYIKRRLKRYQRIGWYYFLGGNLSLPADVLRTDKFSEDFLGYGWEDLELGYRLFKKGVRLYYLPEAINYHLHFWDFEEELKRKEKMGLEAHIFIKKHPRLKTWLGFHTFLMIPYYIIKKHKKARRILEKYGFSRRKSMITELAKHILEEYHYRRGYELGKTMAGIVEGKVLSAETKYDVSVIIVTYNQKELLEKCLDSFFEFTRDINIEVIVVDNHSTDETVFMVKEKFPQVKYKFLDKNYGFAKSINVGLKESKGRYIFLLNNDTLFQSNVLKDLYDYIENNKGIAACGPKLLDEKQKFQRQGSIFLSVILRLAGNPVRVNFLPMTALLLRRKLFLEIGLLDENFFFYNEDLDFAKRMKKAGFIIHYYPHASLIHIGKKSTAQVSSNVIYESYKGGLYFVKKHYPKWVYYVFSILVFIETNFKVFYFLLRKKQKEEIKALKEVQNLIFK